MTTCCPMCEWWPPGPFQHAMAALPRSPQVCTPASTRSSPAAPATPAPSATQQRHAGGVPGRRPRRPGASAGHDGGPSLPFPPLRLRQPVRHAPVRLHVRAGSQPAALPLHVRGVHPRPRARGALLRWLRGNRTSAALRPSPLCSLAGRACRLQCMLEYMGGVTEGIAKSTGLLGPDEVEAVKGEM